MNKRILCVVCLAASAFGVLGSATPALARGAAVNIMNSPGYQRALAESRKQQAAPVAAEQAPKITRHHRRRH